LATATAERRAFAWSGRPLRDPWARCIKINRQARRHGHAGKPRAWRSVGVRDRAGSPGITIAVGPPLPTLWPALSSPA
jgi:hypothetical protein